MTREQLKEYCEAEFENIDVVVTELFFVVKAKTSDYSIAELAAMSTFIHNFYNGIENILKRCLYFREIETKETPTWHKDLLKTASDIGIITDDLFDILSNYLSFRHFFVHSYIFTVKWEELRSLVDSLEETIEKLKSEIYAYIDKTK